VIDWIFYLTFYTLSSLVDQMHRDKLLFIITTHKTLQYITYIHTFTVVLTTQHKSVTPIDPPSWCFYWLIWNGWSNRGCHFCRQSITQDGRTCKGVSSVKYAGVLLTGAVLVNGESNCTSWFTGGTGRTLVSSQLIIQHTHRTFPQSFSWFEFLWK